MKALFPLLACATWSFAWAMPGGTPWINNLILVVAISWGVMAVVVIATKIRRGRE
jgi:hypothetical protein